MDIVHRLGRATAAEIHRELPEAPHPAAVRTLLRILESKGQLRHEKDGPRHVYLANAAKQTVQRSAVRHLLRTFFGGSRTAAVAALLDDDEAPLTEREAREVASLIGKRRREGK